MPVIKNAGVRVGLGRIGFTGSAGPQGFTGSKGDKGSDGSPGGYAGSQGFTGSQGLQGPAGGYTGSEGAVGFTGSLGYTGSSGTTGFTGSVGAQGPAGGFTGSVGYTGSAGAGYTGSKGDTGFDGSVGFTGSKGDIGFSGSKGDAGADGSDGAVGFTGSKGDQGVIGFSGSKGDTGAVGFSGSKGDTGAAGADGADGAVGFTASAGVGYAGSAGAGFTGSQGLVGFTGSAGTGSDSPLVFTTSGDYRTLTGFLESGSTSTIRTAEFHGDLLRLTLATFTPSFSASSTPSSSLNWDVSCTGFSVSVDNPSDVTNDFISSVYSITQTSGSVNGTLSNYTAGSFSQTPAGGVDWNQSFTVDNSNSYIRSTSTNRSGGSAGATVKFNHNDGSESEYTASDTSFSVNWSTASMSVSKNNVSGKTFLKTYSSTSYSTSVSGLNSSSNSSHSLSATGGTLNNTSGSGYVSGTFTFTDPIHKDNTGTTRTISNTCTFTRPANVTGTSYTVDQSSTTSSVSASFTYPSFWIWTSSTGSPPTLTDIIDDSESTGFNSNTNQLANQTHDFSVQAVNNTDSNPRAFWFAVRNSVTQPTTFKTGASSALLSDVSTTDGGTLSLIPNSPPSGLTGESYHLYGITLQPGTTYVEIS